MSDQGTENSKPETIAHFGENPNRLYVGELHHEFEFLGEKWNMSPYVLGLPNSLSAHLNNQTGNFLLDWPNIVGISGYARPHMYTSSPRDVSYEVKLARMHTWAKAIQAYNHIMVDVDAPFNADQVAYLKENRYLPNLDLQQFTKESGKELTVEEVENLVNSGKLPKPKIVSLGGTKGLQALYRALGFLQGEEGGYFVVDWEAFVDKAASGEMVAAWEQLKGR